MNQAKVIYGPGNRIYLYVRVLWPMSRVSEFGHRGRVRKTTRDLVEDGTAIEAGVFE